MPISREEFARLPSTKKLQQVCDFFEKNKDKAYKASELKKHLNLSKSQVFLQIAKLKQSGHIEQKGDYYAFVKSTVSTGREK